MERIHTHISKKQSQWLASRARREGITRAEVLRRIITMAMEQPRAYEAEREMWPNRKQDR